jgi:hypothetical protein
LEEKPGFQNPGIRFSGEGNFRKSYQKALDLSKKPK